MLRALPLLLASTLAGPATATALAASPSPDTPPSRGPLQPDPAPGTRGDTVARGVAQARTYTPSVSPPATTTPKPVQHAPKQPAKHRARVVPVRDVTPQFVDVPVGLGQVARSLRDDASMVLAAIALLAAAAAAASGLALTFVWGREPAS
jgi:hypothetical protein